MTKKGFTLIELLVVIAIIGILASIVLVSLSTARDRARAVAIQGEMTQVRSRAEMDYIDTGNYDLVCEEAGAALGNSTLSNIGDYGRLETSILAKLPTGQTVRCNESTGSAAYAAWAPVPVPTGNFFCVDSTGKAELETAEPAADSTACP